MTIAELKAKKVALLGAGENHRHLSSYLKKQGVEFSVIEWESADDLAEKLDGFEVVFRTPGVPFLSEVIQGVKNKGAEITSQTKLFFDLCPCPIVGVTGTKGKGTTATLVFNLLQAAGRKARLAGNIGTDPFVFLDELAADDLVVLELSSFQLQDLDKSPHVAVVLKTTSEHLDHHQDTKEYVEAKTNIVSHQSADDFAVLNYDQETTRKFAELTQAQIWWNSTEQQVRPGAFVLGDKIMLAADESEAEVMGTNQVGLIGRFNLENITAALCAAAILGVRDAELMRKTISGFRGLPHRLELVAEKQGVKYYNDSYSTVPETAAAALSAFASPVILIAGGSEKNSDYAPLARALSTHPVKALLAVGRTGPKIAKLAKQAGFAGRVVDTGLSDMQKIVSAAQDMADEGDVVLLSPASASFDMFDNYKQRGELFKKFVRRL